MVIPTTPISYPITIVYFHGIQDNFEVMWSKIDYIARVKVAPTPRAKSSDKKKESPSAVSHNVPPIGLIFTTVGTVCMPTINKLRY